MGLLYIWNLFIASEEGCGVDFSVSGLFCFIIHGIWALSKNLSSRDASVARSRVQITDTYLNSVKTYLKWKIED